MKIFMSLIFVNFITNTALAQAPTVNGIPYTPDEYLLSQGQRWFYHTNTSISPKLLNFRSPTENEKSIVEKGKQILEITSAKSIALIEGDDVVWVGYKFPANSQSHFLSQSIGKTITSMAVGKAICQGKFSLDTVTENLIPELKESDLGKSTVRDLLMMASGTWEGNKDTSITSEEQNSRLIAGQMSYLDLIKTSKVNSFQNTLFGARKTGEKFYYRSTDPLTLGIIINISTGMEYAKWVEQEVLLPAGIKTYGIIGRDKYGYGNAAGNIRLTMEDWIRFAIWVKNNQSSPGCFGDYVRAASTTQISNNTQTGVSFGGYGYLIWTDNNRLADSYWAVGYGGQRIGWNHKNRRILIAFSNVENYMGDLYWLYKDWASVEESK
jgi:CubicO group peptidase (beta-lactamase class C family)